MRNRTLVLLGALSLTATAADAQQLNLAADAAGSATGALGGGNASGAIERPLLGPTDAELMLRVHSQLVQKLHGVGVTAEIVDGVATLRGTVATEKERDEAAQIARRVDGVTRVRNEIVVNAAAATEHEAGKPVGTAHATLDATVGASIAAEKKLADHEIGVRADASAVTLTGEVSTQAEKDLAGQIAAKTAGVATVHNKIVVHAD